MNEKRLEAIEQLGKDAAKVLDQCNLPLVVGAAIDQIEMLVDEIRWLRGLTTRKEDQAN